MFMLGSVHDMNDIIYDTEDAHEGWYGFTWGPIWVRMRAGMGSCERAIMGLESRAVSPWITKYF